MHSRTASPTRFRRFVTITLVCAAGLGLPRPAWADRGEPALARPTAHAHGTEPAAEPQPEHDTTVEVVRDASAPTGDETFPRRFFVRGAAGGHIPLVGPMADLGNAGGGLRLALGWYFLRRVAVLAELGAGRIPESAGDDRGRTLASTMLFVRGTVVLVEALTLFGEAGGGAVFSGRQAREKIGLGGAEPMAALSASAGLEVDLLGFLSGEGGMRLELLFAERTWGATSLVVTPFVGLSAHF